MRIHKLEHIQPDDLPKEWRSRLNAATGERYTVFLLPEKQRRRHQGMKRKRSEQPFIGLWADREDMQDVYTYVRHLRKPRY